ncbi:SufB/SufD family protein [Sphingomonas crusticola]|uniref:SufB/SufD family protein n=1 Tax=Sphingomonas crusticola TaxID=1697973 RepID=UPI000E223E2F|nr:SufD family Fe-S cluster assembly protein [Sphingomonas crusticola]
MTSLPTKRDEAWRYSDLQALERIWPVPIPGKIVVPAGDSHYVSLVQDAVADAAIVRDYVIEVGVGASFAMQIVNSGGTLGRVALDVTLYEGASFDLDAALIAGRDQTIELVTTMRHFEAGATSRQTVRGIAGSNGTISYLGKVAVSRDAQKTDSVQSVKGMLLDRTAAVNAKPELEIYADDVKCAHGATVGELDAQALFYLASRGLPPVEAKAVLLRAFVSGLFDGSEDEAKFAAAIDAALERVL